MRDDNNKRVRVSPLSFQKTPPTPPPVCPSYTGIIPPRIPLESSVQSTGCTNDSYQGAPTERLMQPEAQD